jgi:hypothetical protein
MRQDRAEATPGVRRLRSPRSPRKEDPHSRNSFRWLLPAVPTRQSGVPSFRHAPVPSSCGPGLSCAGHDADVPTARSSRWRRAVRARVDPWPLPRCSTGTGWANAGRRGMAASHRATRSDGCAVPDRRLHSRGQPALLPDGLGLVLLRDRQVEGDWRICSARPAYAWARFSSATRESLTTTPAPWELNVFDGDIPVGPPPPPPRTGFFLLPFLRRHRGHAGPARGPRPRGPALARHSVDDARSGYPGDRARPRRATRLARPPVRLPRARDELTARLEARHPSPPGVHSAAISTHSNLIVSTTDGHTERLWIENRPITLFPVQKDRGWNHGDRSPHRFSRAYNWSRMGPRTFRTSRWPRAGLMVGG